MTINLPGNQPGNQASRQLTLTDIVDSRAYEREREAFRSRVIALKRRRRISLGPVVTLLFENRDTIRFQIQEMARVERIITDEGIQEELDIYNPMIPEPGHLSATLFLELTDEEQMRTWLPRLVDIEKSVLFRLPGGGEVRSIPDPRQATQLTRDYVTAAVHYITFDFTADDIAGFGPGSALAIDHPEYIEQLELGAEMLSELQADLRP